MPSQKQIQEILAKEGIEEFTKDIRTMNKREIRKHFSFKSNRKINITKLTKNIIWQSYCWISSGKMEPIEGNLRTFWYLNLKSVFSRIGLKVADDKYINNLYETLSELIVKHRLFRYIDFGFLDDGFYDRFIGNTNGNLILFVEKKGFYPVVRRIAEKYDATTLLFQGFPSYYTTEYLIRAMARNGLLREPVLLFGMADYDPSGYWVVKEFEEQLVNYGVEVQETFPLMKLELFSPDFIEENKYKLGKASIIKNWLKITGGINGQAFGMELDMLKSKKITQVFEDAIKPHLAKAGSKKAASARAMSPERTAWLDWLMR